MSSPISEALRRRKAEGRAGFIAYLTAGDPSLDATVEVAVKLHAAGVDVIELGVPFSDPMIDGPVIQAACGRALKAGATLQGVLEAARRIHDRTSMPLVLYSYVNPLQRYGMDKLGRDAAASGISGILAVDLPADAGAAAHRDWRAAGVDPILLVTPTTTPERRRQTLAAAGGFVYVVALKGMTGGRAAEADQVRPMIEAMRRETDLPLGVGVGIRTPEQVKAIGSFADAVVVGSALVQTLGDGGPNPIDRTAEQARQLVAALAP